MESNNATEKEKPIKEPETLKIHFEERVLKTSPAQRAAQIKECRHTSRCLIIATSLKSLRKLGLIRQRNFQQVRIYNDYLPISDQRNFSFPG